MKLLIIIPCKLDSKRLTKKNIARFKGRPLIFDTIDYAKKTNHDYDLIISTEDVAELTSLLPGENIQKREKCLCGDAEVVDVYINIAQKVNKIYDYVICLQPDNPNRTNSLDSCLNYMIDNNYDDLITVNEEYKRSGAIRIFKFDYLRNSHVSKRIGSLMDKAFDIHDYNDLGIASCD